MGKREGVLLTVLLTAATAALLALPPARQLGTPRGARAFIYAAVCALRGGGSQVLVGVLGQKASLVRLEFCDASYDGRRRSSRLLYWG